MFWWPPWVPTNRDALRNAALGVGILKLISLLIVLVMLPMLLGSTRKADMMLTGCYSSEQHSAVSQPVYSGWQRQLLLSHIPSRGIKGKL